MDEKNKKFIQDTRYLYKKEVSDLRKERAEDLHNLCIKLGGHDFWPQQKILRECVDTELNRFVEIRECSCCGFREEQEIEKETAFSLANKMAKEDCEENTSGAYDECANCGYWHYTHSNSTCKKFVRKEEQ